MILLSLCLIIEVKNGGRGLVGGIGAYIKIPLCLLRRGLGVPWGCLWGVPNGSWEVRRGS